MRELLERLRREIMLPADIEEAIDAELSRPVEPVAWMYTDSTGTYFQNSGDTDHGWIPLFTHPPAKPVLLSDDEIREILLTKESMLIKNYARAIEQAVLRKNGIGGVE